jgi:hypothetical protein
MLNAKLSFSYRLQYHDSFGQIWKNEMLLKEYGEYKIYFWWKDKSNNEKKNCYEDAHIKISGIVELKIILNVDIA